MALNDTQIRKAKPKEKQYKLADGEGMFLLIMPNGSKYWRLKYRHGGKEKTLALGTYPTISLKVARDRRAEARENLANGVDPMEVKKVNKHKVQADVQNNFTVVATEWFVKNKDTWTSPRHIERAQRFIENDLGPVLGNRPISHITPLELLAALRRIEDRGAIESAHRAKWTAGMIWRYAVATGRAERDITVDLKGALQTPQKKHLAAVTAPTEVGKLLHQLDGYDGTAVVKAALRLAPLVFVRPGELRNAMWNGVDLDNALWEIPAEKMKMKQPHVVPLSHQAVVILRELYPYTAYRSEYVFPSARSASRPMSNNAVLSALRRCDIDKEKMSGHGFRAMARTLLEEILDVRPDLIEHQLAHAVRDPNGRAYNRTSHLPARRKMMQQWADYLDALKAQAFGGNVIVADFRMESVA